MSKSRCDVDINHDAIDELLAGAPAMSHVETVAWIVVGALREASPKRSGRLSKSWTARVGRDEDGKAVAWVGTSVPYYHIPQWGSVDVTPQRYIDRGMSRTGLVYEPSPKVG